MTIDAYARRAIAVENSGWASDRMAVSDDLVRPFKTFSMQQQALKTLQDPAAICEMEGRIAHNRAVLDRLGTTCDALGLPKYSLQALRNRRLELSLDIKQDEITVQDAMRPFADKAARLGNVQMVWQMPETRKILEDAKARVKPLHDECKEIVEKIDILENLLKDFKW